MRVFVRPQRAGRLLATGIPILVAALLVPSGTAFAGLLGPEVGASPNAESIRQLYYIIFALACLLFFGVAGLLVYMLVKFRARKGVVAEQIHGNNRLEVGWTVGAALLLVVISVVTLIKLPGIYNPPNSSAAGLPLTDANVLTSTGAREKLPPNRRALVIEVTGQLYAWRFTYEDGDGNNLNNVYAYEQMVVPTNTTVLLRIKSLDVAHSWWIPELGGKHDAVPGYTNFTWMKVTKPGTYRGQCAELCGRNHASMTARVHAIPPDEYQAWYNGQKERIREADRLAAAERKAQAGQQTAAATQQ
ncbi:MAG: cytochrome c oxidase subunit II [Solirubrobacteraceae bacterium]|nr:cytochrome c oxidase subunit II [Solirubrobacteraceae bacterium]